MGLALYLSRVRSSDLLGVIPRSCLRSRLKARYYEGANYIGDAIEKEPEGASKQPSLH